MLTYPELSSELKLTEYQIDLFLRFRADRRDSGICLENKATVTQLRINANALPCARVSKYWRDVISRGKYFPRHSQILLFCIIYGRINVQL